MLQLILKFEDKLKVLNKPEKAVGLFLISSILILSSTYYLRENNQVKFREQLIIAEGHLSRISDPGELVKASEEFYKAYLLRPDSHYVKEKLIFLATFDDLKLQPVSSPVSYVLEPVLSMSRISFIRRQIYILRVLIASSRSRNLRLDLNLLIKVIELQLNRLKFYARNEEDFKNMNHFLLFNEARLSMLKYQASGNIVHLQYSEKKFEQMITEQGSIQIPAAVLWYFRNLIMLGKFEEAKAIQKMASKMTFPNGRIREYNFIRHTISECKVGHEIC